MNNEIAELKQIIEDSDNIVFFGGAGVSTESNIPDFRSENGIYNAVNQYGYPPETMLSHTFFKTHPDIFFDYLRKTLIYPDAKPNNAHIGLAKLEKMGKLKAIVTQNIDNLHQMAGSKTVYELHGTLYRNYCVKCHDTSVYTAVNAIRKADVLIVGGTSLNVYPAAGLIDYYRGNKLVLINKSTTPYDRRANLIIRENIGQVFKEVLDL